MASSDKELEDQLLETGNKLLDPPPSVDELLPLLDQVESCLSRVEQSPSKSMQNALSPSLKALIADNLLKHSDDDVKVAVASCISEITRITAPEAPYDDDQMKEVFQLIVSSFENLSDKSSRSYVKRTSILETVAKVRSCVVMLDLECDALILQMFQHFFKAISLLELISMTPDQLLQKSGKGKRPGKGGNRFYKSIGLGFKTPREAIEGKKVSKAPKIQRLVTPLTLQRKRARIAEKKKRIAKAKSEAAEYQKLLASRLKEQRERRSESLAKRRSKLSTASKQAVAA